MNKECDFYFSFLPFWTRFFIVYSRTCRLLFSYLRLYSLCLDGAGVGVGCFLWEDVSSETDLWAWG